MPKVATLLVVASLLVFVSQRSRAEDHAAPTAHAATEATHHQADTYPHPPIPGPARWPGAALLTAFFMFLAAAVIGPVVRAHTPEEVPPAHSHDEPPGASHHHGSSGTLNVDPHP